MTARPTLSNIDADRILQDLAHHGYPYRPHYNQLRNQLIALLMLDAGLRVGEAVQLQLRDVFWNTLARNPLTLRPEITKTHEPREIPTSVRLRAALSTWLDYLSMGTSLPEETWLFQDRTGYLHITRRTVQRLITAAAERALGRPIHPHVLRHTFGTNVSRVAGTAVAQKLLGHKHLSSTEVYLHPSADDYQTAIRKIEQGNNHGPQT